MFYEELSFMPVLPRPYRITAEILPWNAEPRKIFDMYIADYRVTDSEKRVIVEDECGSVDVMSLKWFCQSYVAKGGRPFYEDRLDRFLWFGRTKKVSGWHPGAEYLMWAANVGEYSGIVCSRSGIGGYGSVLEVNKPGIFHGVGGDWIVCGDEEGRPDIREAYVECDFRFPFRYQFISKDDIWRYASRRDGFGRLVYPCTRSPF